jgi:hypothetical protein
MRRTTAIVTLLAVAFGVASALVAGRCRRAVPKGSEIDVKRQDFTLARDDRHTLMVTPAQWQPHDFLLADFDMLLDVDLGPDTDLDIVLRRVQPHSIEGEKLPFHSRFCVLRLSTIAEGPAWLTREDALFQPRGRGLLVAPGQPATVQIEGRGRLLTATVAGRRLPPFEAADDVGCANLIVHGGKVAVPKWQVLYRGEPTRLPDWLLGALAGLFVAVGGLLCTARTMDLLLSLPLLPIGALMASRGIYGDMPPLLEPSPAYLLLCTVAGVPVMITLWVRRRRDSLLAMPIALAATLLLLDCGRRGEAPRWLSAPAMDAYFGDRSDRGPIEALGQIIRGPFALHTLEPAAHRVLVLGGELLCNRGGLPNNAGHLELHLQGAMRRSLGDNGVEVMSLPTIDGWSAQQWRLFSRFFADFAPQVLIFGVPAMEDAPMPLAADAAAQVQPPPSRGLLDCWQQEPMRPRSSPAELRATLAAAKAFCAAHGTRLVLLADSGLPEPFVAELRAAKSDAVPLVELQAAEKPEAIAARIAAAATPPQ